MEKRILTGIKPTGYAQIGNYFGAIKPAIELSKNSDFDCFYFIADYHALTTLKSADELKQYTKDIACTWLACGLDPNKVVFYRQSDIPRCQAPYARARVAPCSWCQTLLCLSCRLLCYSHTTKPLFCEVLQ